MDWRVVEDAPGAFTIRVDGVEVGTFSLLDRSPVSQVPLYPSVRARLLASAFSDFDDTVVLDTSARERAEFAAAGWSGRAEYHEQVEANRSLTAAFGVEVRARVADAYARHGWPHPLTRTLMDVWQTELLDLLATAERDTRSEVA